MATGRDIHLTKQVGEYLVAAELCRRGVIATTFTGNVPHYDIVASDAHGRHIAIQVKAIKGPSWQFKITDFLDVKMHKDGRRQVLGKVVREPVRKLIMVFVTIGEYGQDQFFVLPWKALRDIIVKNYRSYLEKHNYVRPKSYSSFHTAVLPDMVRKYRNDWELVNRTLQASH